MRSPVGVERPLLVDCVEVLRSASGRRLAVDALEARRDIREQTELSLARQNARGRNNNR